MAGTNRKYWTFISQPMGQKSVILRKDEKSFIYWLKEICNASSNEATDCYNCLNDWPEEFL